MARFITARLIGSMALLLTTCATAGSGEYEVTHPPRIITARADATAYYLEIRARDEAGGFGHSYVTLGTIDAANHGHQTVVAGFMPKSADDDYWSKFGLPVTGLVGVARSDLIQRADARFRIVINKATYFRVVSEIRRLHDTWTSYELVVHNCNSFVSEIASSVGLRTPMIVAQYPVHYVAELRSLNSHP
jgi:hypothetical protein